MWTWWPLFRRRHIQMHSRERKMLCFLTKSERPQWADPVSRRCFTSLAHYKDESVSSLWWVFRRYLYIKSAPGLSAIFVSSVWLSHGGKYLTVCLHQKVNFHHKIAIFCAPKPKASLYTKLISAWAPGVDVNGPNKISVWKRLRKYVFWSYFKNQS